MKFGSVPDPENIDFKLPADHPDTAKLLKSTKGGSFHAFVGCAKWNKADLKNFYPKGTKDELIYYSSQFNCIELNSTFYGMPQKTQVETWKNKTPEDFRFFPKISNSISHFGQLKEVTNLVNQYCDAVAHFEEKLGMVFLQMHENFKPINFSRLEKFILEFPKGIPLAVELRHPEWFSNRDVASEFYQLTEENQVTNVVVDTAGRRDMLHMRLTTPHTFIRYVGANHSSDYQRLEDWLERIAAWKDQGLRTLNFFVHQNIELESPLLSASFIKGLNKKLGTALVIPKTLLDSPNLGQGKLDL